MSNPPVPLLQQLMRLKETTRNADALRFLVSTAEGLRCLRLDEIIALIPEAPVPVVHECTPVNIPDHSDILKQISEQLASHEKRVSDLAEAVTDLQMVEFEYVRDRKDLKPAMPEESVVLGTDALRGGAVDRENVAVGLCAAIGLEGSGNTIVGPYAATDCDGELTNATALGYRALSGATKDLHNVTALGAYAQPTGSDQVVLGDHLTNVHTLNGCHRRSDPRDMHTAGDLQLGLDFVLNVKPIQYTTDFRDAYIDWASKPIEPEPLRAEPQPPTLSPGEKGYQPLLIAYRADKAAWDKEALAYQLAISNYHSELTQWIEDNQLARIRPDGSRAGKRLHAGFNSAQILEILERMGVDSAIAQDHAVSGGQSVKTHSDAEMLAVLWRAFQELVREVRSPELADRVASALIQRHSDIAKATQASVPASPLLPTEA